MNKNQKTERAKNRTHNLVVGIGSTLFFAALVGYGLRVKSADTEGSVAQTTATEKRKEKKMETILTKMNFEVEVLKANQTVLVDFWAPWCGPCRMLAPVLAELAVEKSPQLKIGKVNVDDEPELAAKYGITSIPAVLLFVNGKVVATAIGFMPKPELEAFISAHAP